MNVSVGNDAFQNIHLWLNIFEYRILAGCVNIYMELVQNVWRIINFLSLLFLLLWGAAQIYI